MLAMLERPTNEPVCRPVEASVIRATVIRVVRPPLAELIQLRLVPPPTDCPASVGLSTRSAPVRRTARPVHTARVRLTMRARRLLAVLALLGCVALGVVTVDVVSALAPFSTSTSYPAQEAPYVNPGAAPDSARLVPAAGTSVIVGPGDTLWSLAERVDPAADPRDVIAEIMRLNDLDSSALRAGQLLLLP